LRAWLPGRFCESLHYSGSCSWTNWMVAFVSYVLLLPVPVWA
jgi:hypothetical protein